jgi:hypothetical protein
MGKRKTISFTGAMIDDRFDAIDVLMSGFMNAEREEGYPYLEECIDDITPDLARALRTVRAHVEKNAKENGGVGTFDIREFLQLVKYHRT